MSLGVRACALWESSLLLDESLNYPVADVENPRCKVSYLPPWSQCRRHHTVFPVRHHLTRYVCYIGMPTQVRGSSKAFPSHQLRRKVLIRVNPDPFGKFWCECDSFIFALLSHCNTRGESVAYLTSLTDVGALGWGAFSSWPLSSQKLDSGQLWISRDCPPTPSLFIGSSVLRSSRKGRWFYFRSLQCREELEDKAGHTC